MLVRSLLSLDRVAAHACHRAFAARLLLCCELLLPLAAVLVTASCAPAQTSLQFHGLGTAPIDTAITPNGNLAVVRAGGAADSIVFVDLQTGNVLASFPSNSVPANAIDSVAVTDTRAVALAAAGATDSVHVFDLTTNPPTSLAVHGLASAPVQVRITPDGSKAIVRAGGTVGAITVYDLASGAQVLSLASNSAPVGATGFWDPVSMTYQIALGSRDVLETTDTRAVVLGGAGVTDSVHILDLTTNPPSTLITHQLTSAPADLAITPDGSKVVVRAGGAPTDGHTIYDLATGALLAAFPSNSAPAGAQYQFTDVNGNAIITTGVADAVAVTDTRAATLGAAGATDSVHLFDLTTNPPSSLAIYGLASAPGDLAITPDGSKLVVRAGGATGAITVYDLATGALLTSLPSNSGAPAVDAVEVTDTRAVVVGAAGVTDSVHILDLTANPPATLAVHALASAPRDLSITPDGSVLVVRAGGAPADAITFYDLATGGMLASFGSNSSPGGAFVVPLAVPPWFVFSDGISDAVEVTDTRALTFGAAGATDSVHVFDLGAPAVASQCFDPGPLGTLIGIGDDATFPDHYPLGFAFPMSGSANGSYTHFRVNPNGWLMLTDGTNSPGLPTGFGSVPDLTGAPGSGPLIAPFWRDLNLTAGNGAGLFFDNVSNAGGSCTITWVHAVDWNNQLPTKSFEAELFANGEVRFRYGASTQVIGTGPAHVGVSARNGIADAGASDLSIGGAVAGDAVHEILATGTFDAPGSEFVFAPTTPGFEFGFGCEPASNRAYGTGCYTIAQESFYESFDDAALASAALQGHAIRLAPATNGYTATWLSGGAAGYVPPSGAIDLPRHDDGQELLDLTVLGLSPLPTPYGATTTLYVHDNGIVSTTGPGNDNGAWNTPTNDYTPTAAFRDAPESAFWSWHDWNPADTNGGPIRWHHDASANVLYVTWDGVENFPGATLNPGTMQFQFALATGVVTIVWPAIDTDTSSTYGSGHLIGWSPGGPSLDPGSIPLATSLPLTTASPDVPPITLGAAPAPVSTTTTGTLVTYTTSAIPEAAPSSGVFVAVTFLSLLPPPPVDLVDLALIGAPGCYANIGSLDITLNPTPLGSPAQSAALLFPAGMPPGLDVYAQSVGLFTPGTLPGGLNAFGLVTSNAVRQHVQAF